MARALPKSDAFHQRANRDVPLIAAHDRGGLYRPERARAASIASNRAERRAREGGDRPRDRRIPAGAASRICRRSPAAGRDLRRAARRAGQGRRATPGACSARRSPTRRRWCRRRRTTSPSVDEAMRLGYNWKWGPFELIDKLGAAWLARAACSARAWRCRRCCSARATGRFYRVQDGRRQFLGLDGDYRDIVRARGRAAAGGHQAPLASRC